MEYNYNFEKDEVKVHCIIRKAIENKRKWVIEFYFNNRTFPNIISGRYSSIAKAKIAMYKYQATGKIPWGE